MRLCNHLGHGRDVCDLLVMGGTVVPTDSIGWSWINTLPGQLRAVQVADAFEIAGDRGVQRGCPQDYVVIFPDGTLIALTPAQYTALFAGTVRGEA